MTTQFLNVNALRKFCAERRRWMKPEFIQMLDKHIGQKMEAATLVHNGGRIKMDAAVAAYVGLK